MLAGLLCSLYLILFFLGVGSNLAAFVRTIKVYRWIKKCEWSAAESQQATSNNFPVSNNSRVKHLICFIFVLTVTNLALLLCLCFLISDVLAQGWHLGSTLCWYYWWSENVAKTFVAFLLSAFSLERYLYVTNESKWKLLTNSSLTVATLVVLGFVLVVVLAAPLQPYVGVQTLTLDPTSSSIANFESTNLTKCGISEFIPKWSLRYHVVGSFCFAYVLPFLVSFFSFALILKYSKQNRSTGEEAAELNTTYQSGRTPSISSASTAITLTTGNVERVLPLSKRVTLIAGALSFLYILCWSPYWLTTLMIQFANLNHASAFTLPFTLFVCHVLPYVNATVTGLLFMALAKRVKLLKLSDVVNGSNGDGGGGEAGDEAVVMGKERYHEMATRESFERSSSVAS